MSDRNLLFVVLALQNHLLRKADALTAMNIWITAKHRPIAEIIVECGMMRPDDRQLLDVLIDRQIAHHGSIADSLAALDVSYSIHDVLGRVEDAGVQASVAHIGTVGDGERTARIHPAHSSVGMRYRILRPHAKGGLGEVFVAEDQELHRQVALKEIREDLAGDSVSRGRFLLEAEVTGRLEHPGIVPVYGFSAYPNGRPFYAMRFIKGDNLREAILRYYRPETPYPDDGERRLAFRQLLRRFVDVCNAVAYAHSRGVLHRDIKPGNVMLGKFGETLLIDWGLAKAGVRGQGLGDSEGTELAGDESTFRPSSGSGFAETIAGVALGTPAFMSPEQAEGKLSELGPASDIYSLGATLYMLLTSEPPVADGEIAVMLDKVKRGDFPTARQVNRDTPPALDAICRKAMALKPETRYAAASDLAADVEHWLADEPVAAQPESVWARLGRWYRRNARVAGLLAVLVVILCVGAGGITYLWFTADEERKRVQSAHDRIFTILESQTGKIANHKRLQDPEFRQLREELLTSGVSFYEGLTDELAKRPKDKWKFAQALALLASVRKAQGDRAGAIRAMEEAIASFQLLVNAAPDDLNLVHEYANRLEDLRNYGGKSERIGDIRREVLNLRLMLVAREPDNLAHKRMLALSWYNHAIGLDRQRKKTEARLAAEQAVQTLDACIQGGQASKYESDRLIHALMLLAHLQKKDGSGDYLATAQRAVTTCEKLLRENPRWPGAVKLLLAHDEYALHLNSAGQLWKACDGYAAALQTAQFCLDQFICNHETVNSLRCTVIMEAFNLAKQRAELGELCHRLDCAAAAIDPLNTFRRLVSSNNQTVNLALARQLFEFTNAQSNLMPTDDFLIGELCLPYVQAMCLFNAGDIDKLQGRRMTVLPLWRGAFAKFPGIEKRMHKVSFYRADCMELCRQFAQELAFQNQPDEAMDVLRKAVELGYEDVKHLQDSKEFDPLRSRADFQKLVQEVVGKAK